jgi:cell division protein FtsA
MEGAVEFAEEIFQMPVRVGTPNKIKGLSDYVNDPSFAVAVGLLQYGRQSMEEQQISQKIPTESVLSRIKAWFKGEF